MGPVLVWTAAGPALVLVVLGAAAAALGRTPGRLLPALAGLVEVAAAVLSVGALIGLARGHHLESPVTFVAYAIGLLAVLPVAVLWSLVERTRWSCAVLAVAGFTVAVMAARMQMLWDGRA